MINDVLGCLKRTLKTAAIAFLGICALACQREELPYIFLSQESIVAGPAVSNFKIDVTSNSTWTVRSNADWARVFGETGKRNSTFELIVDENNTAGNRNCEVVVQGDDCIAVISIIQSYGEVALTVPLTDYVVGKDANSLEIKYYVSTEEAGIDALSNADWLTIISVGNGVIKAEIAENTSGEAREGVITTVATDKKGNATVCETLVHQAATENILDVLVDSIKLDSYGETVRIPIVANTEIAAECTSQWCKVNIDDKTVVVSAASNDSGELRETFLLVTTSSDKGETLSKKIYISQDPVVVPDDLLSIPVAELNFDGEADSIRVPFTTDSKVSVKTSSTWLSASVEEMDVVVSVEENATSRLRQGYVTLTTTDGTIGIITVYQAPIVVDSEELTILVPEFTVLSEKSKTVIPFASNTTVSARSNTDWCVVSVKDLDVIAEIAENTSEKSRDAYITLTTKTGVSGVVHIIQSAAENDETIETVEVLVNEVNFLGEADGIKIPYTSDASVNVRTSSEWLTASIVGNDVDIKVTENNSGEIRKGYVTLQTPDGTVAVITVVQAPVNVDSDELTVLIPEIQVLSEKSKTIVPFASNTTVTARSNTDWCVVSVVDQDVVAEIAENTSEKSRDAYITLTTKTGVTGVVHIIQSAAESDDTIDSVQVLVSEVNFLGEADAIKVPYTSDASVKVRASSDWISASVVGSDVKIAVSENKTGEIRKGYVTLQTPDGTVAIITVIQAPVNVDSEELTILIPEIKVLSAETQTIIPFSSNTTVSARSNTDWCSVTVKDQDVIAQISENIGETSRDAFITLTTKTGVTGVVHIIQSAPESDETIETVEVLVDEVNFSGDADSIKLPFSSDATVTARASSDWITATVSGNDVKISVSENNSGILRKGYVTLQTPDGAVAVITVNQAPINVDSDELTILIPELKLLSESSSNIIPFASNSPVSARSNKDWCVVSVVDNDIVAKVSENTGETSRDAYITLTTKTGVAGVVHIIQNAPDSDDESEVVEVLVDEVDFGGNGGSMKVPFVADAPVTVRSSSSWITATVSGNDVEISVPANWSGDRKGYVTLQTSSLCAAIITVNQGSNTPEFTFSTTELTFGSGTSSQYIDVTSSGAWKLSNSDDQMPTWLTVSPKSGTGDAMLTITVQTNKFATSRTATLYFQGTDSGLKTSVSVVQNANSSGISDFKYLGKGYDVSGTYADDAYVKSSVLDCTALAQNDCIADVINPNKTVEATIQGKNLEEYESNYSVKAGVSSEYKGFSGSVKTNFSEQAAGSKEHSYATFRSITKKQILKINDNETAKTLMDYRSAAFVKDVDKLAAADLVAKYGTHVIMGFSLGGVIDYSMAADASKMTTKVNWEVAVKAGFGKEGVGKIETEDSYDQFNSLKSESYGFERTLLCRGGESQYTSTGFDEDSKAATAYSSWLSSLEDSSKWVMVDYEGKQLIPLWEFVADSTKAAAVKTAAEAQIAGAGIVQTSSYKTFEMVLQGMKASDTYGSSLLMCEMNVNLNGTSIDVITSSTNGGYWNDAVAVSKSPDEPFTYQYHPTTGTYSLSKFQKHSVALTVKNGLCSNLASGIINPTKWEPGKPSSWGVVTIYYVPELEQWTYRDSENKDHTFDIDKNGEATVDVLLPETNCMLIFRMDMR